MRAGHSGRQQGTQGGAPERARASGEQKVFGVEVRPLREVVRRAGISARKIKARFGKGGERH